MANPYETPGTDKSSTKSRTGMHLVLLIVTSLVMVLCWVACGFAYWQYTQLESIPANLPARIARGSSATAESQKWASLSFLITSLPAGLALVLAVRKSLALSLFFLMSTIIAVIMIAVLFKPA